MKNAKNKIKQHEKSLKTNLIHKCTHRLYYVVSDLSKGFINQSVQDAEVVLTPTLLHSYVVEGCQYNFRTLYIMLELRRTTSSITNLLDIHCLNSFAL